MQWLNYHHLLYFWHVAREGSLVRASAKLRLAQSTVSGQIHALETSIGEKLFERSGRSLVLTDVGRLVQRYADEIFTLGEELQDALQGRPIGKPLTLSLGVADVVPKLVARRLVEPALRLDESVRLVCREDKHDRLMADLAVHALDVVLSDSPVGPSVRIKAFNHLLGECGVVFCAARKLASKYRRNFPKSLDGAPFLLPTENTSLRRSLDQWFVSQGLRPRVVGEFEDSALLKVFGQTETGIFVTPSIIADEVTQQYQVHIIGRVEDIREHFYAISVERRLKHPAVVAITNEARLRLFA